jgi:hypothetical protein
VASRDDVADFVANLENHFFPVKHDPPSRVTAWLASMFRELGGYSTQVLEEAAKDIVGTRTERYFPLPAECKKACENVRKRSDIAAKAAQLKTGTWTYKRDDEYAEWRIELANDLVKCAIGKQAAKEGWILSLHDYARKYKQMPHPSEIYALKEGAKGFDQAYEQCVRGGWPDAAGLRKLGESMLAKRKQLSEMVLGVSG